MVTRISFSPDKLFQMMFEGKQVLTDKEAPLVLPLLDDPRTKRITGEAHHPGGRCAEPAIRRADRDRTAEAFAVKPIDTGTAGSAVASGRNSHCRQPIVAPETPVPTAARPMPATRRPRGRAAQGGTPAAPGAAAGGSANSAGAAAPPPETDQPWADGEHRARSGSRRAAGEKSRRHAQIRRL